MNRRFDIIQDSSMTPANMNTTWSVIQGHRAPGGYPQGYENKDWKYIERGLSYEEARFTMDTLNEIAQ